MLALAMISLNATSLLAEGGAKKWHLPIYMGFSFNEHESTNVTPISGYTGITFGLGLDYRFLPMCSLSAGMLFISKSYELSTNGDLTRYNPAFLEFPVELIFQPAGWVYFHAGPYLASLVLSGTKVGDGQLEAIKGLFANDYGITLGMWLGIYNNPKLHVGLDLRYDYGLADIQFVKWPNYTIHTRTLMPLFTVTWAW